MFLLRDVALFLPTALTGLQAAIDSAVRRFETEHCSAVCVIPCVRIPRMKASTVVTLPVPVPEWSEEPFQPLCPGIQDSVCPVPHYAGFQVRPLE